MADFSLVVRAAEAALERWGLSGAIDSRVIASLVADGAVYREELLPDGSRLAVIRLYSPVVQREEVFLGNVLLNDFLSKALLRAVNAGGRGRLEILVNDLENFYYLYHGEANLEQMAESLRQELQISLAGLYFGDEDPSRGIYGELGQMLTFYKSNIEPFPVFVLPRAFLSQLLEGVEQRVRELLQEKETNINVILSLLSFFYAKDGAEMQSFYAFLNRAMADGWLPAEAMRQALALGPDEAFTKEVFSGRKKGQTIDWSQFQIAVGQFLNNMRQFLHSGNAVAIASNLAGKMLDLTPAQVVDILLRGVQLGFLPAWGVRQELPLREGMPCRFCGSDPALVAEKNITCGFGTGRFCNQSPKRRPSGEASALCLRCGVSNYLTIKLAGMHIARPQPKAKDYPVPRQYNIVFHYGRHNEAGARRLAEVIDHLLERIAYFQQSAREEKKFFSVEYMRERLAQQEQGAGAPDAGPSGGAPVGEDEALAALLADDAVVPGLDTFSQMSSAVKTRVLPLGMGDYRLLVFILPPFQSGKGEALDFVQRRFSRSRLAAFTLLALLRKLCGCDGPYYFQSVPALAPGGFDSNTFYVQGRAENADDAIRHFSAIANFARRVVNWRDNHSLLADWILLAEQLAEDPMGTFARVLRDSPIRGGEDLRQARYRRLSHDFIGGTGVVDRIEYLKLLEHLKQMASGH